MEVDPDLIEVPNPNNSCRMGDLQCYYDVNKPGEVECDRHSTPCKGYAIIFVPKVEYLTWKLTQ